MYWHDYVVSINYGENVNWIARSPQISPPDCMFSIASTLWSHIPLHIFSYPASYLAPEQIPSRSSLNSQRG